MFKNVSSSSTEESDFQPDEGFGSFSDEEQKNNKPAKKEKEEGGTKKRKVLKKRGRKRNSLRRSFTLLEGNELYFNGLNPDFIIGDPIQSPNDMGCCTCWGIDRITNDKVAIKMVDMNDLNMLEKARNELATLKALGGKSNCIGVKASFTDNQTLHIVQNHTEENLQKRIEHSGKLYDNRAKFVLQQVVECIDFVHKNGFVLTNLSANSILFRFVDSDEILLSDFCESLCLGAISGNSYQLKTRNSLFAPPEVIAAQVLPKDHLSKLDIWPLGIIAFYCLHAQFPFSSGEEICNSMAHTPFHLPHHFKLLIEHCLIKNYKQRPFITELTKVLV